MGRMQGSTLASSAVTPPIQDDIQLNTFYLI